MRQLLILAIIAIFLISTPIHASDKAKKNSSFPLNMEVETQHFKISGLYVRTLCTVEQNKTDLSYKYTIKVSYEADRQILLTWDFLDWILSQYPNAMENQSATSHLFPLKAGKGNYMFRFSSKEAPLWFNDTTIRAYSYGTPSAEQQEHNQEVAEEIGGVYVSSYDYISTDLKAGNTLACPPSNLLVFVK